MSNIGKSQRVPTSYSLRRFSEAEGMALKQKAMEISDESDFSLPTGSFSVSELRYLSVCKIIYDDYAVEVRGGGRTRRVLTYRLTRQYRGQVPRNVEPISAVSDRKGLTASTKPEADVSDERPFCPPVIKRKPLKAMSEAIDVPAKLRLPLFLCITSTFREQATVDLDRANVMVEMLNALAKAGYLKPPRGNKWSLTDPYGRVARAFSGGRLQREEIINWVCLEEGKIPN